VYYILLGLSYQCSSDFLGLYRDRQQAIDAAVRLAKERDEFDDARWDMGVTVTECGEGGDAGTEIGVAEWKYPDSGVKWHDYK